MTHFILAALRAFTRQHKGLARFLLLLGVLAGYFLFLWWKYDLITGGIVAGLTWSFFVLCTPIADAGFLLDFPVRLISGIRMIHSEMGVWAVAFFLNLSALHYAPDAYDKTGLTHLFHKILTTPWPYWSIIALCAAGTFLSVRIGDAVMNKVDGKHNGDHKPAAKGIKNIPRKTWIKWGGTALLYGTTVVVYYVLLRNLHIDPADIAG